MKCVLGCKQDFKRFIQRAGGEQILRPVLFLQSMSQTDILMDTVLL